DGTATANLYAEGQVSGSTTYGGSPQARAYDSNSTPDIRSQIGQQLVFSSFLASVSTIRSVAFASPGGVNLNGRYFDTGTVAGVVTSAQKNFPAWVLTFKPDGTFDAKACKPTSGTDTAGGTSPMTNCSAS